MRDTSPRRRVNDFSPRHAFFGPPTAEMWPKAALASDGSTHVIRLRHVPFVRWGGRDEAAVVGSVASRSAPEDSTLTCRRREPRFSARARRPSAADMLRAGARWLRVPRRLPAPTLRPGACTRLRPPRGSTAAEHGSRAHARWRVKARRPAHALTSLVECARARAEFRRTRHRPPNDRTRATARISPRPARIRRRLRRGTRRAPMRAPPASTLRAERPPWLWRYMSRLALSPGERPGDGSARIAQSVSPARSMPHPTRRA